MAKHESGRPILALGVDDSDEVTAIESCGYGTDSAGSLDEAVEKLASGTYSVSLIGSGMLRTIIESEQVHRNIVERSNDGIVVLQDNLIRFVNPRFCEMSGYSCETLLGTVWTDYLTRDEAAVLFERYRRRMAGEYVPSVYETSLTRRAGSRIYLEVSATVAPWQGRPADLVLVRDIGERKEAEDVLRRYRQLVETARDMILFVSEGYRVVEANEAAVEAYGYSRNELLSMNATNLCADETQDLCALLDQAKGQTVSYETVHRRKDGSTFPVEVSLSSTIIKDEPVHLCIVRDITERKQAQAELDVERRRLRAVLDALPVAVMLADERGGYVEANDQATVIWGGPIPHVSGVEEYSKFIGWRAETRENILPEDWAMARAITKGETTVGEMVDIQRFDGTCGTILNSAAPVMDAEGNIIGGVVAEQDVTELVELRQALERALDQAKQDGWHASVLEGIAEAGLSITELPELLETVAARMANALAADKCCVFVIDDRTGDYEARAAYNEPRLLGCRIKPDEGFVGQVVSQRRAICIADTATDLPESSACDLPPDVRSVLGAPMVARGRILGVLRALSDRHHAFGVEESRLIQAIADLVAVAIDNAKLYEALQHSRAELEEALEREKHFSLLLQHALMPASPKIGEGYSVAVRYVPAFMGREVGGDFYDVFGAGPDRAAILIGDVLGKGLEAASLAATTRSTTHAFVHESPSARDALARANSVLESQKPSPESFVTVCLVTLDLPTGELAYCSAGHPPAVLCRSGGTVELLGGACLPLGVADALDCEQARYQLDPGDKLVLYTDGISEAHDGPVLFDTEGIARILADHAEWNGEEIVDGLIDAATQWSRGDLTDDAVVVVISRAA